MSRDLKLSIGQYSDKGRKETNQDFHGVAIPDQPALGLKGIAIALADGISSSAVSNIASRSAIKSFLADYYCTSDTWSVKTSAQRVIAATNSWLHAQSRRGPYAFDRDKGYVCTMTVMVMKATTAHIFHVGDARVYRVSGSSLEQITNDHRVFASSDQVYLGRALGMKEDVEIDYQRVHLDRGDTFVLTTDGVHEFVTPAFVTDAVRRHANDLDTAARRIVTESFERGSADNLTVQIVRVDELPDDSASGLLDQATDLPVPALPEAGTLFDGYEILRQLHGSSRSHVYLAVDTETGERAVIKIPSIDLRGDPDYLRRFMMEEWIARRINSAHVLRPPVRPRRRNFLYVVTEFVEGQTLAQWMIDNPRPDLETVRGLVEQIAAGLRALHRMEMLHQDLRPGNIMIDRDGTAKIIDFGSTRIAGVMEAIPTTDRNDALGTAQYMAPEYFLTEAGTTRSDLYSLGAIAYHMLTGRLPYGARMARAKTRLQQRKVAYVPASDATRAIPSWIDGALRKAVHPDPNRRYAELSEFLYDLRHPNREVLREGPPPLIERNPSLFWKLLSLVLAAVIAVLLAYPVNH